MLSSLVSHCRATSMAILPKICVLILLWVQSVKSEDDYIVNTGNGALRGRKTVSARDNIEYISFQGIQYGTPPVGELRFKAPLPSTPWQGIRNATKEGPTCLVSTYIGDGSVMPGSSEDCLYLNVFTTTLPGLKDATTKPVMVYIHGGAFTIASGNEDLYGADYLVTEDVVLVTFNYRLGPLGFLSLQTPECPGNWGLKDMVLALEWVQNNINAFGGDPSKVTLFGESAGGAAAELLMLSSRTKGLFQAVIAQSGSALCDWAVQRYPRENAYALGSLSGIDANDDTELLHYLREVPGKYLVGLEDNVYGYTRPLETYLKIPFAPAIEPESEEAVISRDPEDVLASGEFNHVPFVQGLLTMEGLLIVVVNSTTYNMSATDDNLNTILPSEWNLDRNSENAKVIRDLLREFYFSQDSRYNVVDAFSSVYFYNGVFRSMDYMLNLKDRKTPYYFYQFSFNGSKALNKKILPFPYNGTCHADDTSYLFHHHGIFGTRLEPNTREYKAVQTFTAMWTDFAKFGNPTPSTNLWKPMTTEYQGYLDIGDDSIMKTDLHSEERKFWEELYNIETSPS